MHHQNKDMLQPLMFQTSRGQLVTVRQTMPADTALLDELLSRLSERSCRLRYMSSRHFSAEAIQNEAVRMAGRHSPDHTTFIATIQQSIFTSWAALIIGFRWNI